MKKVCCLVLITVLAVNLSGCFLAFVGPKQNDSNVSMPSNGTGSVQVTAVYTFADRPSSKTQKPVETSQKSSRKSTAKTKLTTTTRAAGPARTRTAPASRAPTTKAAVPQNTISLVDITSPVGRNEIATITVKGAPNTKYSISVYYSTTASAAAGLEDTMSDAFGAVTWTWKIGGRTKAGAHKIKIAGGGQQFETQIITTD